MLFCYLFRYREATLGCDGPLPWTYMDSDKHPISCTKEDSGTFENISVKLQWMNARSLMRDLDCPLSCMVEDYGFEEVYTSVVPCPRKMGDRGCQGMVLLGVAKQVCSVRSKTD